MSSLHNHGTGELTHRLEFREVFNSLKEDEIKDEQTYRAYVHHLARACWHGGRIMLRQTSPEAEGIFDFILELNAACNGQWNQLLDYGITQKDLDTWLDFAGMFLSSLGNHFGDGDQKVSPDVSKNTLRKMASISPEATTKLNGIIDIMMAAQPAGLGYPNENNQSAYYPGDEQLTKEEIKAITKMMEVKRIAPENTRLQKRTNKESSEHDHIDDFEILQASAEMDAIPKFLGNVEIENRPASKVFLRRGDHSKEMSKICVDLESASKYATNKQQKAALSQVAESFRTGDYQVFLDAQKTWINDKAPRVDHCMGFLFGYRDPDGVRAEWQAAAGVADSKETSNMNQLVKRSPQFIRTLPWAVPGQNDGKGPFEPSELTVPDFAIIHVLASVSSTVWEATNITIVSFSMPSSLPKIEQEHMIDRMQDDDGKRLGTKNMVYGNRMNLNSSPGRPCYYVHTSEAEAYMKCAHLIRFVETAIHELIGHGTGKLLTETSPGKFNFDHKSPPISPVTDEPIKTWYRPGDTINSVFGKLARTVEECRAFLIADYLADNKDILALFGYHENSPLTADDFIYYAYLQIGVEGLCALRNFNVKDQAWGGDHDQALFVIFKNLVQDSNGTVWIEHDPESGTLFVRVDRSKILSHGKPSIGRICSKIHIWHCTGDVDACRPLYESLSAVDGVYESWRQVVVSNVEPRWKFVQPNTFIDDDGMVEFREYEASNAGIIQSFFERKL